jgi:pimeloyl-ACP methyl ester carboxylesterase
MALASNRVAVRNVTSNGCDIAVYEWGNGPIVILVHGWEGWGLQLEAIAVELAATGFRAIAFDAPAHGVSTGEQSSIYAFHDALCDVAVSVGSIYAIIAHSFGMLPTALALRRGLAAKKVIGLASVCQLSYSVKRFCALRKLPDEVRSVIIALLEGRYGVNVWDHGCAIAAARTLCVPVLLIHDYGDAEVCITQSEMLAAAWSGAKLEATQGLGHRKLLTEPSVIKRLVDFLSA